LLIRVAIAVSITQPDYSERRVVVTGAIDCDEDVAVRGYCHVPRASSLTT
jgi:hypothetical protein